MTNKEAAFILEQFIKRGFCGGAFKEALKTAVKALEKE